MRILSTLAAAGLSLAGLIPLLAPVIIPLHPVSAQEFAPEDAPAEFDEFADLLAPYGRWVDVPDLGPCWQPRVDSSWAPYTVGYWVYTNAGWTWVSEEPFGGVVFHYGRWILTQRGWYWVPGSDWGPAWVSWRTNADYIGWAPLPPEVPWNTSRGIGAWVDVQADIGPRYYRFCSVRNFGASRLHTVVLPVTRNATILVSTTNVTSIRRQDRWVHCGGPDYHWVNQRCARPVVSTQLVLQPSLQAFFSFGFSTRKTNAITDQGLFLPAPSRVYQPRVERFTTPPPRTALQSTRGWSSNREADHKVASHVSQEWERQRSARPTPANLPGSPRPDAPVSAPPVLPPPTLAPSTPPPSATPPPALPTTSSAAPSPSSATPSAALPATSSPAPSAPGDSSAPVLRKTPSSLKTLSPADSHFVPPSPQVSRPLPDPGLATRQPSSSESPAPEKTTSHPPSAPSANPGFSRSKSSPRSQPSVPEDLPPGSPNSREHTASTPPATATPATPILSPARRDPSTAPSMSSPTTPSPTSSRPASQRESASRSRSEPQPVGTNSVINPSSNPAISSRPKIPSNTSPASAVSPGVPPSNAQPSSISPRSSSSASPLPASVTGTPGSAVHLPGMSRSYPTSAPEPTPTRIRSGTVQPPQPQPVLSSPQRSGSSYPSTPSPSFQRPTQAAPSAGSSFPMARPQPSSPAPPSSSSPAPSSPRGPAPSPSTPAKKPASSDKEEKK